MTELLFRPVLTYYYDGKESVVHKVMMKPMENAVVHMFVSDRDKAAEVFNSMINDVNKEWDLMGHGPVKEHEAYCQFIADKINPYIGNLDYKLFHMSIDPENECDLVGMYIKDPRLEVRMSLVPVK